MIWTVWVWCSSKTKPWAWALVIRFCHFSPWLRLAKRPVIPNISRWLSCGENARFFMSWPEPWVWIAFELCIGASRDEAWLCVAQLAPTSMVWFSVNSQFGFFNFIVSLLQVSSWLHDCETGNVTLWCQTLCCHFSCMKWQPHIGYWVWALRQLLFGQVLV